LTLLAESGTKGIRPVKRSIAAILNFTCRFPGLTLWSNIINKIRKLSWLWHWCNLVVVLMMVMAVVVVVALV